MNDHRRWRWRGRSGSGAVMDLSGLGHRAGSRNLQSAFPGGHFLQELSERIVLDVSRHHGA